MIGIDKIYKIIDPENQENYIYIVTHENEVIDIINEFSRGFMDRMQLMKLLRNRNYNYSIIWPEDFEIIEG